MEEKIIIDGVDVAGCISFDKNNGYNICCYDDTREDKIPFANFCVENKDCYYKQLKRLEEKYNKMVDISKENLIKYEDLRIDNQKLIMEIEGLKSQIDFEAQKQAVLLQENEELKEKIIKLTEENGNLIIKRNTVENKLRDTESRLISIQKANTHNLVLLQRLNNAFEEIKEIAESRFCSCNDDYCDLQRKSGECKDSEPCNSYLLRQIAKIITEAIGE